MGHPKDYQTHADRKMVAMAMHATSKPPYDNAPAFLKELEQLRIPHVLVATGEFDPNLVAEPGGSYEVVDRLRAAREKEDGFGGAGLPRTELNVMEATGHGAPRTAVAPFLAPPPPSLSARAAGS